uniref:Uncharacterized protein n=1 Tax=Lactuca sativa TaxID=4236 RepID=A0A9R1X1U0_LACSA|nr:hypothetical protein LSAT_V11C700368500 [Lactuca sativa]
MIENYLFISEEKSKNKNKKEEKLTREKEMKKRCGYPDKIWPNADVSSTFSDERKYGKFKENFHDIINGYKKILNIKDIDMKSSIEILENSTVEGDYEGKYGVLLKPLIL